MIETTLTDSNTIDPRAIKVYEEDDFQVIRSQDYDVITKKLKAWETYAEQAKDLYLHSENKENESAIFKDSAFINYTIAEIAQSILNNRKSEQNQTFYLCLGKDRLQAVLVISNKPHRELIDDIEEEYLEIRLLATHPTNIGSTVIDHPNIKKSMKGAGSCLLRFAEQLAFKKELGVYLEPLDSAIPFYTKRGYRHLKYGDCMVKTKEQIIDQIAEETIHRLKVA